MATDSAKINFIIIVIVSLLFIQIGLFSFFSSNLKDNTSELSSLKEEVNMLKMMLALLWMILLHLKLCWRGVLMYYETILCAGMFWLVEI